MGFTVVPEAAREVLVESDPAFARRGPSGYHRTFHDEIVRRNALALERADPTRVTFFDRTLVDSLAYASHYGWPVPPDVVAAATGVLRLSFVLEALPWRGDAVRFEGPQFAARIEPLIFDAYRSCGVEAIAVPVADVAARVDHVLELAGRPPVR